MELENAITLIGSYSSKASLLGLKQTSDKVNRLVEEKPLTLPPELIHYIDNVCPIKSLIFEGVGNPVEILGREQLSWRMPGYNYDPETEANISNWNDDWFLIAVEGGEPIIVKLDDHSSHSVVYSAMQGEGGWEFFPVADSIGQFLLCAAALDHAMTFPGIGDPLDDDFNLDDQVAVWLFPFIKKHAASYYDEWVSVFENYQQVF
jgi:hypothetical protein